MTFFNGLPEKANETIFKPYNEIEKERKELNKKLQEAHNPKLDDSKQSSEYKQILAQLMELDSFSWVSWVVNDMKREIDKISDKYKQIVDQIAEKTAEKTQTP